MGEHKRALVVGINAYGGGIPRLGSAVRDAEAIAKQLELAHGYDVKLLRDAEAAGKAITASLAEVVEAGLSEDGSFVLYYAGHGIAENDPEEAGPQGFLLPYDAHLTNKETWLGMQALQGALDGLACRHLMLVLDCCYAGAFQWVSTRSVGNVKRPLYKSQYERYLEGKAWQVLTSASYDETADDVAPVTADRGGAETPEGHSPFAQALIEALSGRAADSSRGGMAADGVLTATELHQFIYEKVVVNDRQTPGIFPLKLDNKGEFVFLAPGVELNLEPDPPLDDANNPWLGLDAYAPADHHLFFGREEATTELLGRVEAQRFVAVVGPSGSGKSSLIRAGLLPALEAPAWVTAEAARLTADPTAALNDAQMQLAAAPASERRLLVIDQFDDLFRHADDAARARFLDDVRKLVEAEDGPTVVIALRSDFEPRAADELGDLWTDQA
ncbi:MAG TPA: caspase family protein, partial [Ilumatobacteraceae bacterium]|nr:caspase family protein [Ilumatobacteraceae bacterium]